MKKFFLSFFVATAFTIFAISGRSYLGVDNPSLFTTSSAMGMSVSTSVDGKDELDTSVTPTSSCIVLTKNLFYGNHDIAIERGVTILQDFLRAQGYFHMQSTGFFGSITLTSVQDFQTAHGISPTGFLGPITRAQIQTIDCGDVSSSVPVSSVHSGQGIYTNGTYTGTVADAFYGNIQIQAIIQNGTLSDVTFLQYPNDRPRSTEISTHSMPILTSEAIKAQDAKVDIVSGATQTSIAFQESLAAALSQAKK